MAKGGKKRFDGPAGRVVPIAPMKRPDPGKASLEERMQLPATVAEVIQISEAVTKDVLQQSLPIALGRFTDLLVSQTIHVQALQRAIVEGGLMTLEEFTDVLQSCADDYNADRHDYLEELRKIGGNVDGSNPEGQGGSSGGAEESPDQEVRDGGSEAGAGESGVDGGSGSVPEILPVEDAQNPGLPADS